MKFRPALVACLAAGAVALTGCGTAKVAPSPKATAQPAALTATATPSSTTTTAPATPAVKKSSDPRAGMNPVVMTREAKVITMPDAAVLVSPAQQVAAARWFQDFLRRSSFDFSAAPAKRSPGQWAGDMTPELHADYASQTSQGGGTWGAQWAPEWKKFMREDDITGFSIEVLGNYQAMNHFEHGLRLEVKWNAVYSVFAGAPKVTSDYRGEYVNDLEVGVIPGPSAAQPWQMGMWHYTNNNWQNLT